MANMVMEKLLPSLEKEMLPRLKAKKTEKKRVWFAVSPYLLQFWAGVLVLPDGPCVLCFDSRRWRLPTSWSRSTFWTDCLHWRKSVVPRCVSRRCWSIQTWTRSSTPGRTWRRRSEVSSSDTDSRRASVLCEKLPVAGEHQWNVFKIFLLVKKSVSVRVFL